MRLLLLCLLFMLPAQLYAQSQADTSTQTFTRQQQKRTDKLLKKAYKKQLKLAKKLDAAKNNQVVKELDSLQTAFNKLKAVTNKEELLAKAKILHALDQTNAQLSKKLLLDKSNMEKYKNYIYQNEQLKYLQNKLFKNLSVKYSDMQKAIRDIVPMHKLNNIAQLKARGYQLKQSTPTDSIPAFNSKDTLYREAIKPDEEEATEQDLATELQLPNPITAFNDQLANIPIIKNSKDAFKKYDKLFNKPLKLNEQRFVPLQYRLKPVFSFNITPSDKALAITSKGIIGAGLQLPATDKTTLGIMLHITTSLGYGIKQLKLQFENVSLSGFYNYEFPFKILLEGGYEKSLFGNTNSSYYDKDRAALFSSTLLSIRNDKAYLGIGRRVALAPNRTLNALICYNIIWHLHPDGPHTSPWQFKLTIQ